MICCAAQEVLVFYQIKIQNKNIKWNALHFVSLFKV